MEHLRAWLLSSLALALASACTTTPPRDEPRTITALGFSAGIKNVGLGRTVASNRAVSGLHKVLSPIQFKWTHDDDGSFLELELPPKKISGAATRMIPLAGAQWMSEAKMEVPAGVIARHANIEAVSASSVIEHKDHARAYRLAEARALRELITTAVGTVNAGVHTGKLELTDLVTKIVGNTITVQASGRATVDGFAELPSELKPRLVKAALVEYRMAKEHKRLLKLLERLAVVDVAAGKLEEAAGRYEEAAAVAGPQRRHFLELQLKALKDSGAPEAEEKIAAIEAELAPKSAQAEPAPAK